MKLINGNSLEVLKTFEDNSIDSVVTDPPYGLSFMGKKWDYDVPSVEIWEECLRVLKPGGYLLSFAGTRTQHRMAVNIEDAGFEIRDMIFWNYASGFPKSHNVWKSLKKNCECGIMEAYEKSRNERGLSLQQETKHDLRFMQERNLSQTEPLEKEQGEVLQSGLSEQSSQIQQSESAENVREGQPSMERRDNNEKTEGKLQGSEVREVSERISTNGEEGRLHNGTQVSDGSTHRENVNENRSSTSRRPQSEQQQDREPCTFCKQHFAQAIRAYGFGSAIKPACEPLTLARKPLGKGLTIANNVLEHGTGGINIDGCRVETNGETPKGSGNKSNGSTGIDFHGGNKETGNETSPLGRFPANLIHDGSDEVVELFPETKGDSRKSKSTYDKGHWGNSKPVESTALYNDNGSAARYFYCAKASKKDRNEGVDGLMSIMIEYKTWNEKNTTQEENKVQLLVDTDKSVQKVIGVYGAENKNASEWNTVLFGNCTMEKFLEVNKSITKTETNSITKSQILNWLTHLFTNDYTQVVNYEKVSGSSPVENAAELNTLTTTISEQLVLALGVKNVVSGTQLKISVKDGSNFHSTVKPTKLKQYLVRLVTPKGGTVLDPFMGSGSTGKACKLEGFDFIGIDLDPDYVKIAEARIEAVKKDNTLFNE